MVVANKYHGYWSDLPHCRSSRIAPVVVLRSNSGVISPVARRRCRRCRRRSIGPFISPTTRSSSSSSSITPVTIGSIDNRLRAALLAMTIVVAVAALDSGPIARLGTVTSSVALLVTVAALHNARLVTFAGHVAFLAAVVTCTSAAASASASFTGARLGAIRLVVAGQELADDLGNSDIGGANPIKRRDKYVPRLVAVEA